MIRALIAGWSRIATGNTAAALLRLLGLAIAARALELPELGIIVLIEAYVRLVDGFLNTQSSVNVLTKFLAEIDPQRDTDRFRGMVKAGFLIDLATAVFCCVLAVILLPVVTVWSGIPADWYGPAMLFCTIILTRILGTAEAVLRCFDRFWAIGLRDATAGGIIVLLSLVAWHRELGPVWFLAIWFAGEAIANFLYLGWAVRVLHHRGVRQIWRGDARREVRASAGFWPMLLQTALIYGIRTLSQNGDVLIAGAVVGSAGAGLLRTAKSLAGFISFFMHPVRQVASVPIARLWAANKIDELLAYSKKICLAAAAIGTVATAIFAVAGGLVLQYGFGPEFVPARLAAVLLMVSNTLYFSGLILIPLMLSIGESARSLYGILLGTLAFAIVVALSVWSWGIAGIALGQVAFNAVWLAYCWRAVVARLERHRLQASAAP